MSDAEASRAAPWRRRRFGAVSGASRAPRARAALPRAVPHYHRVPSEALGQRHRRRGRSRSPGTRAGGQYPPQRLRPRAGRPGRRRGSTTGGGALDGERAPRTWVPFWVAWAGKCSR